MALTEILINGINPGYDIGTKIRITAIPTKYKNYDLYGKTGIVRSTHVNNMAILVDGVSNRSSGWGYFYLPAHCITHVDNKEDNNMIIDCNNIKNYLNAVKIKFIGDCNPCKYVYANFESDVKVGDLVVVKPAHHAISLARVEEILEGNDYETTREVVAKVYTDYYDDRVKTRNQAAELKAKMQERARQLQDIALYQMLAKDDPDMQTLLNEYQSLAKF